MASPPAATQRDAPAPTAREVANNPGLLQVALMLRGVRLAPRARQRVRRRPGPVAAFGNVGDIDLILPARTWASAPAGGPQAGSSPWVLDVDADSVQFVLCYRPGPDTSGECPDPIPVEYVPPSPLYERTTSRGVPLWQFATLHGGYLALSAVARCAFVGSDGQCRFCSLSALGGGDERVPVEDIVEAVRIARDHHRIEMVYLSIGYDATPDGGIRQVEPYVRELKRHFDVLIAVDALPPADDAWIDRTYAMGVDSLSYNLEVFDPDRFARICPGPARAIGRARFLDALSYATTVFPAGAVTCHLIVGLEPLASTRQGIDELVGRRVVPVLPIFRPFKGRDLRSESDRGATALTTGELARLYAYLYKALRAARIPMQWVRQISAVTTPAEGRFFVEDGGKVSLWERLLGAHRRPSALLSDWRRALRVKEVDDSLHSSGL